MKKILKIIYFYLKVIQFVLNQIGINLLQLKNLLYFIKYFSDIIKYKKLNGQIDYIFPVLGEHKKTSGHITDDYFYQDNQDNRNYVKKIPGNLGTKLLNFFEFIYNGKNIKNLTIEDNLELFKISNIIEISKFDDVLLKYMQIYKDWCRLNNKEIYDKKDRPIIHKEFVKEDHY